MSQLRSGRLLGGLNSNARVLATADFRAPLKTSLALTRGTGAPTYARATTGTVVDHEGVVRTCLAGEARFTGARRVWNLISGSSEDLTNANWTKDAGVTTTYGFTDPLGTSRASKLVMTGSAKSCYNSSSPGYTFPYTGFEYFWLRGEVGGEQIQIGDQSNLYTITLTTDWVKYQTPLRSVVSGYPQIRSVSAGTTTIYATLIQREDVTGQSVQTAGEYVSVGGLGYRSSQDPLYLSLPGTAGHYVSTPDSVAASVTGDIDIRVKAYRSDWAGQTDYKAFVAKTSTLVGALSYELLTNNAADTNLNFFFTLDGTTLRTATSSVGTGFAAGTTNWIRVTRSSTSGNVIFYTSSDGVTWVQLGATITPAPGALYDGATSLSLGGYTSGSSYFNDIKIYEAKIYSGINGTLVADFNPQRDASTLTGTITSSTTSEVWTISGGASVVRNAAYHGSGVDGVKSFDTTLAGAPIPSATLKGYLSEPARTNLLLRSQEFDNASWSSVAVTISANAAVAPDGTLTADKLLETAVTSSHTRYQTFAGTSGTYTTSVYMKAAERTWGFITEGNSVTASAYFDLSLGVVGTVSGTGSPTATIEPAANGFYRCTLSFVAGANANAQFGAAIANGNAFYAGDITKGIYVWGAQFEAGPYASSYIPTTTAAVTRNADVLTYPSAGNISDTAGTSYVAFSARGITGSNQQILARDTNGRFPYVSSFTDRTQLYDGTTQNNATAGPSFVNSTQKSAQSWGAGTKSISYAGTAIASSAYDGTQGSGAIAIGCNNAGTEQLGGNVGNVCIWTRTLPDAILKRISK